MLIGCSLLVILAFYIGRRTHAALNELRTSHGGDTVSRLGGEAEAGEGFLGSCRRENCVTPSSCPFHMVHIHFCRVGLVFFRLLHVWHLVVLSQSWLRHSVKWYSCCYMPIIFCLLMCCCHTSCMLCAIICGCPTCGTRCFLSFCVSRRSRGAFWLTLLDVYHVVLAHVLHFRATWCFITHLSSGDVVDVSRVSLCEVVIFVIATRLLSYGGAGIVFRVRVLPHAHHAVPSQTSQMWCSRT